MLSLEMNVSVLFAYYWPEVRCTDILISKGRLANVVLLGALEEENMGF